MSQQEDFAIIEMVDQRDDMFLCSWPTPLWKKDLNNILIPSLICRTWTEFWDQSQDRQERDYNIKLSRCQSW